MGLRHKEENLKKHEQEAKTSQPSSYQAPKHYIDDSVEFDAIERLKSNIMMLDDLQKRLGFMNTELESIIGSKKR